MSERAVELVDWESFKKDALARGEVWVGTASLEECQNLWEDFKNFLVLSGFNV